jgi:hypothetical protein
MLRISNFGNPERFAKGLRVYTTQVNESMLRISNFGNPERFAKEKRREVSRLYILHPTPLISYFLSLPSYLLSLPSFTDFQHLL